MVTINFLFICLTNFEKEGFFRGTSYENILKQRTFFMMQGYEDANDVEHLKHDPVIKKVLGGNLSEL